MLFKKKELSVGDVEEIIRVFELKPEYRFCVWSSESEFACGVSVYDPNKELNDRKNKVIEIHETPDLITVIDYRDEVNCPIYTLGEPLES